MKTTVPLVIRSPSLGASEILPSVARSTTSTSEESKLLKASEIKKHFVTMDESHQLNVYVGQDTYGNYANNVQNALMLKLAKAGLINFDLPEPEMKT